MKRGTFYVITGVGEVRPRLTLARGMIDDEMQVGFSQVPWSEGEYLTALYDLPTGRAIHVFYTRGEAMKYVSDNRDRIEEIRKGDFYQRCLADYQAMRKEVEQDGNITGAAEGIPAGGRKGK